MTTGSDTGTSSDNARVRSGRAFRGCLLALLLAAGAFVMALALSSPGYGWLGCVALIPLYLAMARCSPACAALCGALWGGSLHFFAAIVFDATIPEDLRTLVLLSAIPAVYAWAGARLTRWIGFSPLVLGVGWIGVELAFEPLGLRNGLLGATQADTTLMHWVGGALGYVLVAFIVAYVNAAMLSVLAYVQLPVPRAQPRLGAGRYVRQLVAQISAGTSVCAIPQLCPRAPPVRTILLPCV